MPTYTMRDCPVCEAAGPHFAEGEEYGCATCSAWFGEVDHSAPRSPDRYAAIIDAASRKPRQANDLSGWLPGNRP